MIGSSFSSIYPAGNSTHTVSLVKTLGCITNKVFPSLVTGNIIAALPSLPPFTIFSLGIIIPFCNVQS